MPPRAGVTGMAETGELPGSFRSGIDRMSEATFEHPPVALRLAPSSIRDRTQAKLRARAVPKAVAWPVLLLVCVGN